MAPKTTNEEALGFRRRLVLGTALATSAFVGGYRGYVRRAFADCTSTGGTYSCSGALTSTQDLAGTPLAVSTDPGFSIVTTAGNAFTLDGTGGLTFTDNNLSTITGTDNGIYAINSDGGALSITTTGTVTGTNFTGIYALNGDGVTVSAANVTGGRIGIQARNTGIGDLAITAGTVVGGNDDGIRASNAGGDLTIDTGAVSGGDSGIIAHNYGTGALSIIASGSVTGGSNDGIDARSDNAAGTDLTIKVLGDVGGGRDGIYAYNGGTGALAISVSGTVAGGSNWDGIYAKNSGTDLTIDVGAVNGHENGIIAKNEHGALSITTGAVTGQGFTGIYANNAGTDLTITANDDVSGAHFGIDAYNSGSGSLSITTAGAVTGGDAEGISAISANGDLTIDAKGDVSGAGQGIFANSRGTGALSITASGNVTGAANDGIDAQNDGTDLTIKTDGDVRGYSNGINASNHGTGGLSITTAGTVAGTHSYGIRAVNYGTGALSISTTGPVNGTGDYAAGIGAFGRGDTTDVTVKAQGDVRGGQQGIIAANLGSGALSISTTGTVTGTKSDGIYAYASYRGTGLTINADGDVSGYSSGITVFGHNAGALSITTAGTVTGSTSDGIFARSYGTDLTIKAASASGDFRGIFANNGGSGALSIAASGAVTGFDAAGIYAINDAGSYATDLTISTAGVTGGTHGIEARNYGRGTVSIDTSGMVTGNAGDGIVAINSYTNDLNIRAVDVNGSVRGIYAHNAGTGVLSITTTGGVTGGLDGIVAGAGNYTTGLSVDVHDVSGQISGISAYNLGGGALSITTSGAVTASSGAGIVASNYSTAIGATSIVTVKDGSAVTSDYSVGVVFFSPTARAATLDNAGSITGVVGVLANAGATTISNAGTITGTAGAAIDLTRISGTGTVNQKGGTITGDILLSSVASTVNVTGGAIDGNVVGQGNADLNFALGGDIFTFAAPFSITGMAAVAMNSGTAAIAGTIDTDALTVSGGTMIVAGAVNTPAFALNGGVLSVASDANLGSGAGALDFDGGTFRNTAAFATGRDVTLNAGGGTIETAADLMLTKGITGAGALTKTGTAKLILNDTNTFAGLTSINGGTLVVGDDSHAGASLAGNVQVNAGGTLGGIGTVGATTIASGGTIAPGNSIGTLTVKGDITFAAGSTYDVEINPALDSDLIDASGAATIDGGTVYVLKAGGVYTPDSRWTIIGADGGVTGTFDTLDQNMPFVDLSLAYDADHVYIDATRNDVAFCDVAGTSNQCSTGDGVETTGAGNPVYDAVAAIPDEDSARQALDALSGEIHASVKSALIEDSHFVRDAVSDRIRSAFGEANGADMPVMAYGEGGPRPVAADSIGPVAWGYAFGAWGSFDGDGNAAAMDTSTGGFLTGIDGALASDIRLGLLAGYSHSSFHVEDRASSGSSDNYHLGLYGGGQWNALRLHGGLAYTRHDIGTSRSVAFPGFADSLSAEYHAGTFQAFGEAGYRIDTGAASFEPFANLAYVSLHTDGFREEGGAAALDVHGETTDATFTTLGVHVSSGFRLGGMKATARGTLGWRHAFGNTVPLSTHAFAGGDPFAIAGVQIARDAAVVEAGLDLAVSPQATLGLAYQGQIAGQAEQHGFKANFKVQF